MTCDSAVDVAMLAVSVGGLAESESFRSAFELEVAFGLRRLRRLSSVGTGTDAGN